MIRRDSSLVAESWGQPHLGTATVGLDLFCASGSVVITGLRVNREAGDDKVRGNQKPRTWQGSIKWPPSLSTKPQGQDLLHLVAAKPQFLLFRPVHRELNRS